MASPTLLGNGLCMAEVIAIGYASELAFMNKAEIPLGRGGSLVLVPSVPPSLLRGLTPLPYLQSRGTRYCFVRRLRCEKTWRVEKQGEMLSIGRNRSQPPRSNRSMSLGGMDYADPKRKSNVTRKLILAAGLTALCIIMLKQSPSFNAPNMFAVHEKGLTHVLVTGGAGYIGSHASLQLLKDSYRVTIVDNLSRGNLGAVRVLQELFPEPGRLQFIYADLGDAKAVNRIFSQNAFDAVMHFAAVAYVGESTMEPLRYYHNITSNTLVVLEAMAAHGVKTLIYSSTCATYGEPEKMPITESTPQVPINPYGKAKKMAEDIIIDFSKNSDMAIMILRYFNVIGSDPEGRLGEAPRPELREHGRISGACFDAARGIITGLKVKGTDYNTPDGTCIRDYIDVTDLVDAHVKALQKAQPKKVGIYNVGTGKGRSVNEFVEACKKATGAKIKVEFLSRRPGDYAEVYSDPTKIRVDLNWTAKHVNLEESLATAWRWQKSHIDGYGSSSSANYA
ncbi:hypothetical protein MLD38_016655 [Melastoma candidum]|uniref:Uncharacterized protein n=1 Tax=Melastoma candidum TaxID=119954 RepID=A0ACB9QR82_9MYRT|nr:hypothetical protein MLD38_016655 [Melastoma candidum]